MSAFVTTPSPLRIGIDYRPGVYGRGGIAVYTRELVTALAAAHPDDTLALYAKRFRRRRDARPADVPADNITLHDGRLPSRALPWLDRVGYGVGRLLGGVDVLHLTDYTTLPAGDVPVVATIHDVLFDELPDCYTPSMTAGLRAVTRRITDLAAALVVPSERTKRGLERHYGVTAERITVVPHGVTPLPPVAAVPAGERYVLSVGTLEPRKNLRRLIAAVGEARRQVPDLTLVVAGARGWLDEPIVDALAAHSWIRYEGAVDKARLAPLYANAHVVAYPSLGEGFGLPVLEALRAGRPTLVGSDTTPEDVAQDAALAVDPRDVDAMGTALVALSQDDALRARLSSAGPARAATFSWDRAARATRDVYALAACAEAVS